MRKMLVLMTCLWASVSGLYAQVERPKLVVGIVVDQMRADYLYRFYDKFSEGGFKRMMREGFHGQNTHYNYVPTETAPGHATVYTGTIPAIHGIVGNEWYEKGASRYCVFDSTVNTVGAETLNGKMSPRNMFVTTIGDQLKLATNQQAKVIGISIKDRGAILPAGHTANGAFWYDRLAGRFISSTFYGATLPDWVQRYNDLKRPDQFLTETWSPLLPLDQYTESLSDDNPFERISPGKETPTFPYNLAEIKEAMQKQQMKQSPYDFLTYTPFGNTLVKEMALAALEGESLGEDAITDLLAISFSSTDIIGHAFGLNSVELQDCYLRLDKDLADILAALDKKVGKGNYLVFLTADHAAVEVPAYLNSLQMPSGYFKVREMKQSVQDYLAGLYGEGAWLEEADDKQIYFNHALLQEKKLNPVVLQQQVAAYLRNFEGVYNTYIAEDMQREEYSLGLRHLLQNGFYPNRCGDVLLQLKPGWLTDYWGRGTSHGSPYTYDTQVPLLFWGWRIRPTTTTEWLQVIDIAPTLAMLLHVQLPSGAIGKPIQALFK